MRLLAASPPGSFPLSRMRSAESLGAHVLRNRSRRSPTLSRRRTNITSNHARSITDMALAGNESASRVRTSSELSASSRHRQDWILAEDPAVSPALDDEVEEEGDSPIRSSESGFRADDRLADVWLTRVTATRALRRQWLSDAISGDRSRSSSAFPSWSTLRITDRPYRAKRFRSAVCRRLLESGQTS